MSSIFQHFKKNVSIFFALSIFIFASTVSLTFAQTAGPSGGGTPVCTGDLNTFACLDNSFCEQYPENIRCVDIHWCESYPDDPRCITPEFCQAQPDYEKCVPDVPEDCRDVTGAPVSCEPDGNPTNDPTICRDAFGTPVECPSDDPDDKYCPDGTPYDPLKRCPKPKDNKFPGDNGRDCVDEVPGTAGILVQVPCGDPEDDICAHPDYKNDPDCCQEWDPTGQRCLDPNGDGNNDDDGNCEKGVPGTPGFTALALCDGQQLGDNQCESDIAGTPFLVPCNDDGDAYNGCVAKYDKKMCDGDPNNDYDDLPDDPDQREAILKLAEYCPDYMKIFQGYSDKNGDLLHVGGWSDPIIRYDVVLVVQRFEECKDLAKFKGDFPFLDVPADHYAYDAVGESYTEGKTEGYTENGVKKFKGNNNVLTTEALKWIMLVKTTESAVNAVADNGMLNPAVFNQVQWAVQWWLAALDWNVASANVVGNYYDVDPVRPATRGEIALWLANTLGL